MKLFGSRKNKKNTVIRPSAYTTNPIEEDETDGASVSGFNSSFGGKTAAKRPFATERELSKDVKKHRRGRRRTFAVVLASIALLALAGFAVLEIWIHAPEVETGGLNEPTTPTPSVAPSSVPSAAAAATATPAPPPAATGRLPGTYTFLALGKDDIGLNTDTIMVGKLDTQNETLDIVSVPRDTLVNVAWGNRKINGIYANAGVPGTGDIDGVMDGLQDILGVPLDNYILININAFEEMVDTIGGIYYDVPRDMFYDDPGQDLHIAISAGPQLLSGENALKVVRFRGGNGGSGYANGDLGRIDTQQDFLLTRPSRC
jgi:LCP family protein required for cell wall assembly